MPDKYTNIESCGLVIMKKNVVADGNIAIYRKRPQKHVLSLLIQFAPQTKLLVNKNGFRGWT
jgi:hypothetical protein